MKLIVGLGNPGKEYENTRHNVGFSIIDNYLKKKQINSSFKLKFNGLYLETMIDNEKIIFLKPQSYINLSGEVIRKFIDYFSISIDDLLIIHDDLDTPLGSIKLKEQGSSGGHNGLKNIELHLNTQKYNRVKIGISNNKTIDTKDYVLGRFSNEESEVLYNVINSTFNIINDYLTMSFTNLMNKYNKK